MSDLELRDLLNQGFNSDDITIGGDGRHFDVRIVSDKFENLSMLERQQMVYSLVNEHIKAGNLHAVNIHAVTPSEWKQHNG